MSNEIKYLVSGWKNDKNGHWKQFKIIIEGSNYEDARMYFDYMAYRNDETVTLKVDSIECIYN